MRSSRLMVVGVLAGALATAGACARPGTNAAPVAEASAAPGPSSPSPSPSPPDPTAAFTGAITTTRTTSATFTVDSDIAGVAVMHGTGAIDPANHRQSTTITVTADHKTMHTQAIVIGTDLY